MSPINFLTEFLRIDPLWNHIKSSGFSVDLLTTLDGLQIVIAPLIPLLLLIEVGVLIFLKKFPGRSYRAAALAHVTNVLVSRVLALNLIAFCAMHLKPYALWDMPFQWYGILSSYVIWEFSHFIYHYSSHKVRLLWCFHSVHHIPEHMNMSVIYSSHFAEGLYADIIRTSICVMLGVPLSLILLMMFASGIWQGFTHASEHFMPSVWLNRLEKFILTPGHHWVHHARNPQYIDKNFCNFLMMWDWVFRTLKHPEKDVVIDYGITRPGDSGSYFDVYFREAIYLWRDIKNARNMNERFLYVFMPPGWQPTAISPVGESV